MSDLRVSNLRGRTSGSSPSLPDGVVVTGICSATDFSGITNSPADFPNGITGVAATFTGNVSIAGTLTYDDVTRIDSVGIVTAGGGLYVGRTEGTGTGIGATFTTAGDAILAGVVTATSFSGSGANLSGIDAAPSISGIASGAISAGNAVIMHSDSKLGAITGQASARGTITDITGSSNTLRGTCYDTNEDRVVMCYRGIGNKGQARVGQVSGTSITWGSAVDFEAGNTSMINACFDSTNNKVVVFYRDDSDSNRARVVVGTVDGSSNTIVFGTPVDPALAVQVEYLSCCYCPEIDRVAIAWVNDDHSDDRGEVRMAQVSGTGASATVTFGSMVVFTESGDKAIHTGIGWDSGQERLIILWGDYSNGERGTCKAASISGSTITLGSVTVYDTQKCDKQKEVKYDPTTGKNLIVWSQGSGSVGNYAKARVATVSGTTFSFGTEATMAASSCTQTSMAYDVNAKKWFCVYVDTGDGQKAKSVVGTMSGTDITFGSPYTFNTDGNANNGETSCVYDPDQKVNIAFTLNNSGAQASYFIDKLRFSNATSNNFMGFSQAAYTNGQTAKLDVIGSTNTNQSGLTTATQYYVLGDGSLGTTADVENIKAGKALSATNLLVNG